MDIHAINEKYNREKGELNMFNRETNQKEKIKEVLENSIETEEDLMRTYLITAERIHDDDELKERLENFAEGNAKRTKQLIDELKDHKS
jgi:rubrerythrin